MTNQPNFITVHYPGTKTDEAIALTGERTVDEILARVKTILEAN